MIQPSDHAAQNGLLKKKAEITADPSGGAAIVNLIKKKTLWKKKKRLISGLKSAD